MENYEYILETEHVSKNFGNLVVLKDINLKVKKGEVICIIGPSGAGKSTYLRSLNQLEKISSGKIFIKGDLFLHREKDRTVERIDKKTQQKLLLEMGMCFQRFNLFPHKTVLENICLAPIEVKHEDKETIKKAVEEAKKVLNDESADKDKFEEATKELSDKIMPIGAKLYQSASEDAKSDDNKSGDKSNDNDEPIEGEVVDK